MLIFEVEGKPVAWASHGGSGRRSFNPRYKEREYVRWQLKSQYSGKEPLCGALWAHFMFFIPIPKNTSSIKKKQMLAGIIRPITRPDRTNYTKFFEDCLTGIVIEDDSIIVDGPISKMYGDIPKMVVKICPIAEYALGHSPVY